MVCTYSLCHYAYVYLSLYIISADAGASTEDSGLTVGIIAAIVVILVLVIFISVVILVCCCNYGK